MPFKPLPEVFLDRLSQLQRVPHAQVVDLGSGEGAFGRLLAESQIPTVEMDCSALAQGESIALRGDALQPPIRPQSLDCLLAGNLWHHLLVQDADGGFLARWLKLLKPQGTLFIFEDEPSPDDPAAKNYLNLQIILAELMPNHRGPLRSREFFLNWASELIPAQNWRSGIIENRNKPDSHAVCQMLAPDGASQTPKGPVGQLLSSIQKHGLSYGSYWWAVAQVNDKGW